MQTDISARWLGTPAARRGPGPFRLAAAAALLTVIVGCTGDAGARKKAAPNLDPDRSISPQDLQVVDCLLPGQTRQLGRQVSYLSRRRPIRTTAFDCAIRGGEYVAYDRADYQTALRVWLETAESGDAEAQYYVGEIYERGLGTEPDYAKAAEWYKRAAEQGYSQAQINLGFLYEKGLGGLEQDGRQALEWYRKATGVSGVIMLDSEIVAIRQELIDANARLETAEAQSEELERAVESARMELASVRSSEGAAAAEKAAMENKLADLERKLTNDRQLVADLRTQRQRHDIAGPTIEIIDTTAVRSLPAARRETSSEIVGRVEAPAGLSILTVDGEKLTVEERGFFRFNPSARRVTIVATDLQGKRDQLLFDLDAKDEASRRERRKGMNFGPYHALLIGNTDYKALPGIETAGDDVVALKSLLETDYGFEITMLRNATYLDVLAAFSTLREKLGEKDNLVVYYAGHGALDAVSGLGYWLPVDAEPNDKTNWISSREVSLQLSLLPSKHVLVIADSCYSGALTRSALARIEGASDGERNAWLRDALAKRSRSALTSGGLQPVLDTGGGGHSIFARSVLDTLSESRDVLEANRLWSAVKARVMLETRALRREQVPEYAPIRFAGHAGGEFFFVPQAR